MSISSLFRAAAVATLIGIGPAWAEDAPDAEAAYTKTITDRAEKIVGALKIEDATKSGRVRAILVQQYRDLRAIHDPRDAGLKAAKGNQELSKADREKKMEELKADAEHKLESLHASFLAALGKELSDEQVDQVKDGLTYNTLQVTYGRYLKLFPNLSSEQKSTILGHLKEAREKAMDGSTSEEKHGWFGKYKGRINNYFSAQGLDMKQAEKDLSAKEKAEKESAAVSN